MELVIDHHIVASITIFGMVLDILGALYLAYELLGRKRGPLRSLTEIMTYEIIGVLVGIIGASIGFVIAFKLNLSIIAIKGYYATLGGTIGYGVGGGIGTALGYGTGLILRKRKLKSPHHKPLSYWSRIIIGCAIGINFALMTFLVLLLGRILINDLRSGIGFGLGLGITVGFIYGISAGAFYGSSNEKNVVAATETTNMSVIQPESTISIDHWSSNQPIFIIIVSLVIVQLIQVFIKWLSSKLLSKCSSIFMLDKFDFTILALTTMLDFLHKNRRLKKQATLPPSPEIVKTTLFENIFTKLTFSKFDLIFTSLVGLFIMGPFSGIGYWIVYGANLIVAILVGSLIGLIIGLASGFAVSLSQHLDVWVEKLPEQRM